jgi:hypothetical protein
MPLILAAVLATAGLPVRSVAIPPAAISKPVRIECPVGQLTQVVFPERLMLLKASAGAADALGVAAQQSSPLGVVSIRPTKVSTGTLELRGPSLVLVIAVQGVEKGGPSEIRLTLAPPAPPAPPAASPKPSPIPSPTADAALLSLPTPAPTAAPPTLPIGRTIPELVPSSQIGGVAAPQRSAAPLALSATPAPPVVGFDAEAFKAAKAVGIGRREGLPGEPEMVLETAFTGARSVWLSFSLRGAAKARVASVAWEGGEIGEYTQEPAGKDLRILVQLPKRKVSRTTRVTVKIESGGTYRFALNTGTFTDFLKGLFR